MIAIRPVPQVASNSTSSTASRSFSDLIQQPAPASTSKSGPAPSNDSRAQDENFALLQLQIAMQRENMIFTAISNILKARHETAKSIISNIR